MINICKELWDAKAMREAFSVEKIKNEDYDLTDLMKLTFETLWNNGKPLGQPKVNLDRITTVDDGGYQGTLLWLIPFDTDQPEEYEYLMTYCYYGSCSGCDTLLSLYRDVELYRKSYEELIPDLVELCRDIFFCTIKPYNCGWREDEKYKTAEVDNGQCFVF